MNLPIWFSVGLIAASVATATATPHNASHGLSPAEQWVVAQATAGEIADLDGALNADQTKKFPEEKDRRLSAHFLENLLTVALPGFKPHRKGVRIIGATIDEPIDLRNAQIPCEAWMDHCQFNSTVNFNNASFAGVASFDDSAFKASAMFNGMKVGHTAFFRKAVFEGSVDFITAEIASIFDADEAQFNNKEKDANFNSMKVGHTAFFRKAVFEGPVDFIRAEIASNLEASEAQFNNKEKDANFNSMKVGHIAFFRKAVFEGSVDFITAEIASIFDADEAQFNNKEKDANFNGMKVGHTAFFRKAVFEGPVDFGGADIASNLEASEAQFNNKEKDANFNGMKVGHTAFFRKAVFEGSVDFITAEIASNLEASEAQFNNKEKDANFNGMKVGHTAFFQKAVFEGPVDFTRAEIASNFEVIGAKFQTKETGADFRGMKVGGYVLFRDAVFEGPVNFRLAEFNWLDMSGSSWPKVAAQFHIEGMTYKYICAVRNNEPESHKTLLKLADQSAYTADVYSNLEEFFKRQGYRADADEAFIAGKCRERKEYFDSGDWGRWLGSWMLYLLVGYGRHPERAGYVGLGIIVLGCILFSPAKMELQDPKELEKPEDMRHQYNRFWYSLGLFLPVVDLKSSELWKPMKKHPFLRNYVRVHILLGWILIPLVLAALTGLIK